MSTYVVHQAGNSKIRVELNCKGRRIPICGTMGGSDQVIESVSHADNPGRKIALGIEDYLDNFTRANDAESWKQFAIAHSMQWKSRFFKVMNDPNVEVLFNLKGIDVWGGVTRASRGAGGATDWELLQIMQNEGWWARIKWMKDGVQMPNPFE